MQLVELKGLLLQDCCGGDEGICFSNFREVVGYMTTEPPRLGGSECCACRGTTSYGGPILEYLHTAKNNLKSQIAKTNLEFSTNDV